MGLQWSGGESGTERVRVMTYNIKVMSAAKQRANAQALAREVARHDPDILVMQDAEGLLIGRSEPVGYSGPVFGLGHVYASGQYVVASRFALRDCGTAPMGSGSEGHRYLRCVVDARGVELNLITAHFQSPRAGLNAARHEGLDGADDWQRNHANRLQQARHLARDLAGSRRPLVLAGDLNAPQTSPVIGSLLATGLRDAFTSAGRGYGYSHGHSLRNGFDLLRIDHVLVSPDIGVMACFVGQSDASEHRPVIADLLFGAEARSLASSVEPMPVADRFNAGAGPGKATQSEEDGSTPLDSLLAPPRGHLLVDEFVDRGQLARELGQQLLRLPGFAHQVLWHGRQSRARVRRLRAAAG